MVKVTLAIPGCAQSVPCPIKRLSQGVQQGKAVLWHPQSHGITNIDQGLVCGVWICSQITPGYPFKGSEDKEKTSRRKSSVYPINLVIGIKKNLNIKSIKEEFLPGRNYEDVEDNDDDDDKDDNNNNCNIMDVALSALGWVKTWGSITK